MNNELRETSSKNEALEVAVNKLDGKDIVELLEVAMWTTVLGAMVVCLTGSEINIGNGKFVLSGKRNYAAK